MVVKSMWNGLIVEGDVLTETLPFDPPLHGLNSMPYKYAEDVCVSGAISQRINIYKHLTPEAKDEIEDLLIEAAKS